MNPHASGMEYMDPLRVTLALAVLVLASRQDLRERMAEDYHWMLIGGAGLLYLSYRIVTEGLPWQFGFLVLGVAILFSDLFWDRPEGRWFVSLLVYGSALALIGYVVIFYHGESEFWSFLTVPLLYLLFLLFYTFDIIKGGADAKCLIALSILFPDYPSFMGVLPLIHVPSATAGLVLPFALMVLFHAALFTVLSVFYNLLRNLRAGDLRFPQLLLGYRLPLDEARAGHYWPMEKLDGEEVVLTRSPQEEAEEVYDALESKGSNRVWVTPKIPFLVPVTLAVAFLAVVGNIMFLLL